jgi:hypothetical protein
MNIKAGYDSFALFEMGRVHNKVDSVAEGAVPEEYNLLSMVVASKNTKANGAAFFQARTYLDYLANDLGLQFEYEPIHAMPDFPTTKPFEPSRSAFVSIKGTKIMLGIVGEFRTAVHEALKLPGYSAGFEIGTLELLEAIKGAGSQYASLLRYPKTQQDITLEVSSTLAQSQRSSDRLNLAIRSPSSSSTTALGRAPPIEVPIKRRFSTCSASPPATTASSARMASAMRWSLASSSVWLKTRRGAGGVGLSPNPSAPARSSGECSR